MRDKANAMRELVEAVKALREQAAKEAWNPPDFFRAFLQEVPRLLAALDHEQDRRQRGEIYDAIAQRVGTGINGPRPECLGALHEICDEQDPELRARGAAPSDTVRAAVRAALVKATVRYATSDGAWRREIELYLQLGSRVVRSVESIDLSWEDCPSDVREAHLRDGLAEVSFKLIPRN